jgi:hypothetical protein
VAAAAGILMLAIALFVVAYPVFRRPDAPSRPAGTPITQKLSELLARRDTTYATLKELDLDLELGKLAPSDYQALRSQYRAQAVVVLQELDSLQSSLVIEDRASEQASDQATATDGQRQRDPTRCPGCGSSLGPGDRFCRRCGTALGDGQK